MAYWVEMSLSHSGDNEKIDELVDAVDQAHPEHVVFTAAGSD